MPPRMIQVFKCPICEKESLTFMDNQDKYVTKISKIHHLKCGACGLKISSASYRGI